MRYLALVFTLLLGALFSPSVGLAQTRGGGPDSAREFCRHHFKAVDTAETLLSAKGVRRKLPPFLAALLAESERGTFDRRYFFRLGTTLSRYLHQTEVTADEIGGDFKPTSLQYSSRNDTAGIFVLHSARPERLGAWDSSHKFYAQDERYGAEDFHVYVDSYGYSRTAREFSRPLPAQAFVQPRPAYASDSGYSFISSESFDKLGKFPPSYGRRGATPCFIHVGVLQTGDSELDRLDINEQQADRLALLYVVASVRARRWLVPAFHGSLEERYADERFDERSLALLDKHIQSLVSYLKRPESGENYLRTKYYEQRLGTELKRQKKAFSQRVRSLTPVERTVPGGEGTESGYMYSDVKAVLDTTKAELLESLGPAEYAGLRAYIKENFPKPESLLTPERSATSSNACCLNVSLPPSYFQDSWIPVVRVRRAVATVFALIDTASGNRGTLDLVLISVPQRAHFVFRNGLGKMSDGWGGSTSTNFWRGKYTFVVEAEGHVPITGNLNTIDPRGTTLECTLSRNGPGSCVLR